MHWVPLGDPGLRHRAAVIARWIDRWAPRAVVVDQSVEVGLLARLHGVPVVAVTAPGRRSDPAHALGFGVASAVVGAWPPSMTGQLLPDRPETLPEVHAVGAVSRFAVQMRPTTVRRRPHAVLMAGTGGDSFTRDSVAAARTETPGWDWTVLSRSLGTWHRDPLAVLVQADVVVLHPGENALAEVASLRRPRCSCRRRGRSTSST